MPNKQRMKEIEDSIVEFLSNNKRNYYLLSDLSRYLPIGKHEHKYLTNILNKLTRKGVISKKGKRFAVQSSANSEAKTVTGTFDATSLIRGYSYAFVNHPDGDILIDSEDTGNAFHNDKVLIELKYKKRGLLYGTVKSVVERANDTFTGNMSILGKKPVFTPDLKKIHLTFNVTDTKNAKDGDKVIVRIDNWGDRKTGTKPEVKVTEIIGKAGEKEVEELAIFRQFNLPLEFPPAVTEEVDAMEENITEEEIARRADFRELPTITIDPPTAKDYDDAISLEIIKHPEDKKTTAYKLYVHIADVSHYVDLKSNLFKEAIERGNSFYFPRRVVPMLPERLSNKICSLRPNEDKLTMTVITEFDINLKILKQSVHNSIIRSFFRLNYDEVDDFFAGKEEAVPQEIGSMLNELRIISEKLSRKRYEKGYIPFNMPELEVIFDDEGNVSELTRTKETESHKLVENCMLLANEYIAALLAKKSKEGVYRVHEEPDQERFEKMVDLLNYYRIRIRKTASAQKAVQSLLLSMPNQDYHRVFDYLILRTMKKARYDTKPIGHFGLATKNYTHFTSPIRRICDLTVHHLVKIKKAGLSDSYIEQQVQGDNDEESVSLLATIATKATEREVLADSAERETAVLYKRLYMSDKLGEIFDGIIVNLSKSMISVELNTIPVLGFIPIASLEDDRYRFYQEYMELVGRKSGKILRLMDRVSVQVVRIDFDVIFSLVAKHKS